MAETPALVHEYLDVRVRSPVIEAGAVEQTAGTVAAGALLLTQNGAIRPLRGNVLATGASRPTPWRSALLVATETDPQGSIAPA